MKQFDWSTDLPDAGKRLDAYLSEYLEGYSRTYIQKLIEQGCVTVNGRLEKRSFRLQGDEELSLTLPDNEAPPVEAEDIPLDIVYEDDWLLVVNKPKGMVVHPAPGHRSGTLVNAVMFHAGKSLSGINGVLRPGIVHRIDRDTTGLLLVCKNDRAHEAIAEQLKEHSVTRRYTALAEGRFGEDEGTVDAPIGRDKKNRLRMGIDRTGGKEAVTGPGPFPGLYAFILPARDRPDPSDTRAHGIDRPSAGRGSAVRRAFARQRARTVSACGRSGISSSRRRPVSGV